MNHLGKLARYKNWANRLLFAEITKLPEDALVAPQAIVFGNLLRTLNHVLAMDFVWRSHLLGKPHELTTRNPDFCPSLEEIRIAQQEMDAWYIDYADALGAPTRNEMVHFFFIGGGPGVMTREDIVLHVVNHGTYHRGHVAQMMRGTSGSVPITDYPVYLKTLVPT
jgi:uncharacterized damage-inducible protein DinB